MELKRKTFGATQDHRNQRVGTAAPITGAAAPDGLFSKSQTGANFNFQHFRHSSSRELVLQRQLTGKCTLFSCQKCHQTHPWPRAGAAAPELVLQRQLTGEKRRSDFPLDSWRTRRPKTGAAAPKMLLQRHWSCWNELNDVAGWDWRMLSVWLCWGSLKTWPEQIQASIPFLQNKSKSF